jgi:predicted outer membrane repeat protein
MQTHIIRNAYLLLLLSVCAIPFALAQRTTVKGNRRANTITVTNTNDSGPGSLRQALADANDGDTVGFAVTGTIGLTTGELVIDKNVTISGPGSNLLTVRPSQGGFFRVFHVMPSHSITIQGVTISFGYAGFAQGGGIYLDEHVTATIADCSLTNNYTGDIGGAIFIDGYGGGATLTVLNSTITGNTAGTAEHGGMGAGIYSSAGTFMIIDSTVSNNTAWTDNSYFGGHGGGIVSGGGGTLEISNTTISGNQAGIDGGGVSIFSGTATITNSTISGNVAGFTQPGEIGAGGGVSNFGTLMIINSTISGNHAHGSTFKGGGEGGGIYNGGSADIGNSTFSGNQADVHGGSIYGTFDVGNSILNGGSPENIYTTVFSHGYNVCSDDGGGFLNGPGDQVNIDPLLGPLQNNGGPTFTHELLKGSPAIDGGDPNFTPPPYYDQRGPVFWRVRNGRIDIGSFEAQVGTTPSPTPTPTASPIPTASPSATTTPTPTATFTPTPTATVTVTPTSTPRVTPTPRLQPTPRSRPTPAPRP